MATGSIQSVEIVSFVRGYHKYKDSWCPLVGEYLFLKTEPTNGKDVMAVSIVKDEQIVGHVPRRLAPLMFYFLSRDFNRGIVEIKGQPLNRGAGMGMEVPCIYRLFGPTAYVSIFKKKIEILP